MILIRKYKERVYNRKILLVFTVLLFLFTVSIHTYAKSAYDIDEINKLISHLNTDSPEIRQFKSGSTNPEKFIEKLLEYYKTRTSVKHFVNPDFRTQFVGNYADSSDFMIANNALNHIFIGQRAYPPHFCGDDINWNSRPVADNEWVWQLNRMYFWSSVAKVYWHTGDEKYAKEWCYQFIDWTKKNPNDKNHKYAWRSIEAGIRGHSWMSLYQHFIGSPHFSSEVLVAFLNSCYDHAEFLMTKYRSGSNWGLMEAEGMAFIAITFPEFKDAEKWKTEAFKRLNNEINIQVYPDGHQLELAMGYHLGCINWFLRTYHLAKLNGIEDAFPESYLEKIQKMCEVPMKLCLPNGTNVQFGDAWAGKPGQHKERFKEWADFFNREDFLFLATGGLEGVKPDSTAYMLPFSGLYSMRSGWNSDAVCLVLKCGPDGGGHSQPDNGTFDVYAGGRNLMPDAGSYIYSGDSEGRRWFRQTKVHQTLTLNGENTVYAPKLVLWKSGKKTDVLVVENHSYESLKHRRSVFFVDKKYFVVVDEAIGNATGDVDIHFQFAPGDVIFNRAEFSVKSEFEDGWNIYVKSQKQPGMKLKEEEGRVSFEYTKKEPRPAFCYSLKKEKEATVVRFVTLVVPYQSKLPEIDILGFNAKQNQLEITLVENGVRNQIGCEIF
ncbi:alginate lyase family protein [Maribellus maritimus]|uniref:alginate lyase family protein n=1 Tax=Maribellus maritimus TaxID=2870838 RepID=UPI001EE9DBEC|nr:alginate lyase family protein [Maribellus maritimus]MCG6189741.1 heparinase II/III family protein [Maribellus maritimus]